MDTSNKTIKYCFIAATTCIIWLTILATIILIQNQCLQSSIIKQSNYTPATICSADSVENSNRDLKVCFDSAETSVNNINDNRLLHSEIMVSETSDLLDRIVAHLSLVVNSVNNVLTSGSILIAILTLFIGLVGFFAYHNLKTDVEKEVNKAQNTINAISKSIQTYQNDINNKIAFFEPFKTLMTNHANYLNKSVDYLFFNALSTIIEKTEDKDLRDRLFHDFSIITLYRNDLKISVKESAKLLHRKKEALEYLSDNAKPEDCNDLEFIVKNESDEYIKRRLIEIITIIKSIDENDSANSIS